MKRLLFTLAFALAALTGVASAQHETSTATRLAPAAFADLGTPINGSVRYCTNCQATSPCTAGGSGASASRINGAWNCSSGGTGTTLTDSASLRSALIDESGTGAAIFAGGNVGAATATSLAATGGVSAAIFSSTPQALTDGATVTWDLNAGQYATVTLGGSRTLSISNSATGKSGCLVITQDGTGSRTLTLPASSKVGGGGSGAVTLSTTAGAVDILCVFYVGSTAYFNLLTNYN